MSKLRNIEQDVKVDKELLVKIWSVKQDILTDWVLSSHGKKIQVGRFNEISKDED